MEAQNQTFNQRWDKLETARRQTRKIAYALMAVVLTSLVVAIA
ncbi:hypothetical protein [Paucimonas lemoignei]|nr:hypothetical protein [Paucimonas lemoignei]